MKRCDNCFEMNSDGATNCVICGEPLEVPQVVEVSASGESLKMTDEEAAQAFDDPEGDEMALPTTSAIQAFGLDEDGSPTDVSSTLAGPGDTEVIDRDADTSASVGSTEVTSVDSTLVGATDEAEAEETEEAEAEETEEAEAEETEEAEAEEPAEAAPGDVVLQVFHDEEKRVVHTHPVTNDITLVGREDPQRDIFPDLDLTKLTGEGVSGNNASRQHFRLLREGDKYFLFVYRGSTGTQVNKEIIEVPNYGKRFEIQVGDRIILGGKVRMKLTHQE